MAVSISRAVGPNGPFHFQAPKEFDDTKNSREQFRFKLEAYFNMMNLSFNKARERIEQNLEVGGGLEKYLTDVDGHHHAAL